MFGNRSRRIRSRIARNNRFGMATSAIWNTTYREWATTFAPILINLSRNVVSDQCRTDLGRARRRRKLPRSRLQTRCTAFRTDLLYDLPLAPVAGRLRGPMIESSPSAAPSPRASACRRLRRRQMSDRILTPTARSHFISSDTCSCSYGRFGPTCHKRKPKGRLSKLRLVVAPLTIWMPW